MLKKLVISLFLTALMSVAAFAQSGSISGTVTTRLNGDAVPGVRIKVAKTNLSTETDASGNYKLENLEPGSYTIVSHIEGFADQARIVVVGAGDTKLNFSIDVRDISAEVNVTATGREESVYESFSTVGSVGTTAIIKSVNSGLGETLKTEAGVTVRSFGGPGTSRPSIRGFEGDRVFIAQDGIRNGSVGSTSGDHGEPVQVLNLERIEIIKGPATLLYGSNAIGGVVNAITDDENEAHEGFRGYFTTFAGDVDRQGGAAGGVEFGTGPNLFNFDTSFTREGDFDTPLGRIPNSGSRAYGFSGRYGYFVDKGFFKASATIDRRRFGIPYAPLFESRELLSIINGGIDCGGEEEEEEFGEEEESPCLYNPSELQRIFANQLPPIPDEQIDLDMERNNFRAVGGFRGLENGITSGTFTIDYTDYQHQELENEDGVDEIATTFSNEVLSYRAVFQQQKYNNWSGQFGIDGFFREFSTVGAESLVDGPVDHNNFAVFGLQEFSFENFALQLGGRVENNAYRPVNNALPDLDFTGFSGSIGARFEVWEGGALFGSFNSSYRAPALEELYNFGPHIGTVTFEIGDTTLNRERSNGFEVSFRQNSSKVRFNGSFFYNNINDFVYQQPFDEDGDGNIDVDDGLPVTLFAQADAVYFGADASLEADINKYFGFFARADAVNAELTDLGFAPPRITPARFRTGVDIRYKGLSVRPEGLFVADRSGDIFPLETATDGYSLLNVNGSYNFVSGRTAHIITFGMHNLTDELYRNHVNFLKDIVPERDRGFKVSYTVRLF